LNNNNIKNISITIAIFNVTSSEKERPIIRRDSRAKRHTDSGRDNSTYSKAKLGIRTRIANI